MADARSLIAERVSQLDATPIYADAHGELDPDISHFVRTMDAIVPPDVPSGPLSASVADELISECRLISRLGKKARSVVVGPLERGEQYWIATGRPDHLPARDPRLAREHFVRATDAEVSAVNTKPFGLGLYTSTGVLGTVGMWWCLLRLTSPSTLFPPPWSVWHVDASPDAKVLEITTASEWVEFVLADPIREGTLVYPDWIRVASHTDGVHMTVRAVAATQGLRFAAGKDVIAPPYWSVESTLWLRWEFSNVNLMPESYAGANT